MTNKKARILLIFGALAINILCHSLTVLIPIRTTALKVLGSYAAVLLSGVALCFLPLRFHVAAQIFVVFAASVGNCMSMYAHWGMYDLIIHYLSGVVLAAGGYELDKKWYVPLLLSWAGAGAWEIFEFSSDVLIGAGMQGDAFDTMTDIIAGFLGGATWTVGRAIRGKLTIDI